MKEASWQDCIDSKSSIKVTPNQQKANSLIETSNDRIKYSNKELNENNANFVFEDYYSSVLELIHSIVILKGFNVKNHICLGFYIKDILKDEELFLIFDDCRYKRNSLTYYGSRMDFETAKQTIAKCKILIKRLKNIKD
jgi:uncharacterized protein (UPF0332 family)